MLWRNDERRPVVDRYPCAGEIHDYMTRWVDGESVAVSFPADEPPLSGWTPVPIPPGVKHVPVCDEGAE